MGKADKFFVYGSIYNEKETREEHGAVWDCQGLGECKTEEEALVLLQKAINNKSDNEDEDNFHIEKEVWNGLYYEKDESYGEGFGAKRLYEFQ